MKPYKQRAGVSIKRPVIERIEGIHPYKMISYLLISVTCLLYSFICFLFIKHLAIELEGAYAFELPKFFTVSSLLLLSSVYFTSRVLSAYKNDDILKLRRLLSYTIVAGLLFAVSQTIAWIELLSEEMDFEKNMILTYLYTFSGVHLAYVMIGMIMSVILFYRYMLIENDPVKTLIVTTNPTERVKLEIYQIFWNFNALSWTLIFLMLHFIF